MRKPKSTSGAVIAGAYLLLTLAAASPLVLEGYIGHGNGISLLLATALTSPLSVVLILVTDFLSDVNAFHMTGWPYFLTLGELAAGALLNARLLYWLDGYVRRKWFGARP